MNLKRFKIAFCWLCILVSSYTLKAQPINLNLSKIKTVSDLVQLLKDNESDKNCIIKSYNLMLYAKNGSVEQVEGIGKSAASSLKLILDNLKIGDVLVFENILIQCNNSSTNTPVSNKTLNVIQ